jgi:hypothetical protein
VSRTGRTSTSEPGQERANRVDVDGKATLDLAVDNTLDHFFGGKGGFEFFPGLGALGFFARQLGFAKTVLDRFQRDLHFVADAQGALARRIHELGPGNNTLGFESRVHGDPLVVDIDHHAGDDGTGLHIDGLEAFFKKISEGFAHYIVTCLCWLAQSADRSSRRNGSS